MGPNLLAGESMVLPPIRQHWIAILKPVAVGTTAYGFGLLLLGESGLHFSSSIDGLLPWTWTVVIVLLAARQYLQWTDNFLTITDQRLIVGSGWVIPLVRIIDVRSVQSRLERLVDVGTVGVRLSEGKCVVLRNFARPSMLRDQLFVLSEQVRTGL